MASAEEAAQKQKRKTDENKKASREGEKGRGKPRKQAREGIHGYRGSYTEMKLGNTKVVYQGSQRSIQHGGISVSMLLPLAVSPAEP